jgi:signal transduction histidine kinase
LQKPLATSPAQPSLARRIVKQFQATTEQHHLSVLTALDYLVVFIDPGRIEQVPGTLVSNAIRFSPESGPIEVSVWKKSETGKARLSVRDSGIGIPLQQQARIFGRFARAENARKIGGTGLGLYICRALVEQHGGRM